MWNIRLVLDASGWYNVEGGFGAQGRKSSEEAVIRIQGKMVKPKL